MELRDLIGALEAPMLMGADNVDITNIQSDSRRVTKGSLFVAVRGTAVDGHAYMDSAIEKGARRRRWVFWFPAGMVILPGNWCW